MKSRDKYYSFLNLFNDCQEKAILAIRDLTSCNFRTAKIRTIVQNVRFEGANENFSEIEKYIDTIVNMIDNGYDVTVFLNDDSLNDDELFKLEEIDEVGLDKFKEEMCLLNISGKALEYLFYRESALKDKANKEIKRIKGKIEDVNKKVDYRDGEITRLKGKVKELESRTYVHAKLF